MNAKVERLDQRIAKLTEKYDAIAAHCGVDPWGRARTWTVEGNTQVSGETHVEVDWQPARSGSRRSALTVRQGSIDADGLATWNERFTTTRDYDHDQLWGP